jgi:hypothetical protein
MTTVSPLSALSTNLLRQARASLIFTVRIFTSIVYIEKVHYLPRTVNRIPSKGGRWFPEWGTIAPEVRGQWSVVGAQSLRASEVRAIEPQISEVSRQPSLGGVRPI